MEACKYCRQASRCIVLTPFRLKKLLQLKNIRDFLTGVRLFLQEPSHEQKLIKSNNKLFRKLEGGFKKTNLFMTEQTEAFTAYLQKALGPNERAKVNGIGSVMCK